MEDERTTIEEAATSIISLYRDHYDELDATFRIAAWAALICYAALSTAAPVAGIPQEDIEKVMEPVDDLILAYGPTPED